MHEYEWGIILSTTGGKAINEGRKKPVGHIEKFKFKYEIVNCLYRQTIMQTRQHVKKNSHAKLETIPFATFDKNKNNFDKQVKCVREVIKEPPAFIYLEDKIRAEIASISNTTSRLVNLRDQACKC